MPDPLTAEEVAAIAAYDGPIYKARTGESGLDPEYGHLNKSARKNLEAHRATNKLIRQYHAEGKNDREVGELLGMKQVTVQLRRVRMGI